MPYRAAAPQPDDMPPQLAIYCNRLWTVAELRADAVELERPNGRRATVPIPTDGLLLNPTTEEQEAADWELLAAVAQELATRGIEAAPRYRDDGWLLAAKLPAGIAPEGIAAMWELSVVEGKQEGAFTNFSFSAY
jgi:hypothetical protein